MPNIILIGPTAPDPLHNGRRYPELQPHLIREDKGREIESQQLHSQFHSKQTEPIALFVGFRSGMDGGRAAVAPSARVSDTVHWGIESLPEDKEGI